MSNELTNDEQAVLIDQFEEAYRRSQTEYDTSVRTIAAGAVAVTASLVAALGEAGWSGVLAVGFSLASLGTNLLSYWTAQFDTSARMKSVWARDRKGVFGRRWKTVTTLLNATTGLLLLAAGVCLVVFVSSSA